MDGFKMDLENLKGVLSRFDKIDQALKEDVSAEIDASAEKIARDAKKTAASNSFDEGTLAGRINVIRTSKYVREIGANIFYAPYIEFGTKTYVKVPEGLETYAAQFKGKAPGGGDFYDFALKILAWIKRKGIVSKEATFKYSSKIKDGKLKTRKTRQGTKDQKFEQDLKVAEGIAYTILKKGIRPRPFMFPAFNEEKPKLLKRLAEILLK